MRAYERLLQYVVIDTQSDEYSETVPTTKKQFDLANRLVEEMKDLGIRRCLRRQYVLRIRKSSGNKGHGTLS